MIGGIAGPMTAVETDICSWSHHGQSRNHSRNSLRFFFFFFFLLLLCVKPKTKKQKKTKKQNKTKEIVRSLGTWWEATHELLHLHQHQSSHGDHLLDDRGGTRWWCDLLSCWFALQSQVLLFDRPHLHISALKRPTPVRSLLSLTQACRERSDSGQHLDGETIYSRSLLVDGWHYANHILAIQWAFVSLEGQLTEGLFCL